jgi:hypothetical protein
LFLANKIQAHLAPFLKGKMANQSPLGVLSKRLCNFMANFLHQFFCKPLWPAPFWALTFKENSKFIVSPEISQIQFACSLAAPPANILPSAALSASFFCLAQHHTGPGSGSNSTVHCDDVFTASCAPTGKHWARLSLAWFWGVVMVAMKTASNAEVGVPLISSANR